MVGALETPAEKLAAIKADKLGDWAAFTTWLTSEYDAEELADFHFDDEEDLDIYAKFRAVTSAARHKEAAQKRQAAAAAAMGAKRAPKEQVEVNRALGQKAAAEERLRLDGRWPPRRDPMLIVPRPEHAWVY